METQQNPPVSEYQFSRLLGRDVHYASEEWRHECEVVTILRMPTKEGRAAHLRLMEKHRSKAAIDRIKADMQRIYDMDRGKVDK